LCNKKIKCLFCATIVPTVICFLPLQPKVNHHIRWHNNKLAQVGTLPIDKLYARDLTKFLRMQQRHGVNTSPDSGRRWRPSPNATALSESRTHRLKAGYPPQLEPRKSLQKPAIKGTRRTRHYAPQEPYIGHDDSRFCALLPLLLALRARASFSAPAAILSTIQWARLQVLLDSCHKTRCSEPLMLDGRVPIELCIRR
jgi:hypothetical protein